MIADLSRIISEYVDPETYTILKSIGYPIVTLSKYEKLVVDQLRDSEELRYLIAEYKLSATQLKTEMDNLHTNIRLGRFDELKNPDDFPHVKWSKKLDYLYPQIDKIFKDKLESLLQNMKILGYITYSYQNDDLIINDIKSERCIVIKLSNVAKLPKLDNLSPFWKFLYRLANNRRGLMTDPLLVEYL